MTAEETGMRAADGPVVDAGVHVYVPSSDALREYMRSPWRERPIPGPQEYVHPWPAGDYSVDSPPGVLPASDPGTVVRDVFEHGGAGLAVLLPLGRGLLPDAELDAEVCAATNRWLVETWLDGVDERFRGSIRVSPADPRRAAREIEQWAGHPRMVQVAVRTQALAPYGQRQYLPIWEAAARHDLPVALHVDGGSSIGFAPVAVGHVGNPLHFHALQPWNYAYHLASFIAEGVFDRLPSLTVVFADGGYDVLAPLGWRLEKDFRPTRVAMPWTRRLPSEYIQAHVRFCLTRHDLTSAVRTAGRWLHMGGAAQVLMFASNYPMHDVLTLDDLPDELTGDLRRDVLHGTARRTYHLDGGHRQGRLLERSQP